MNNEILEIEDFINLKHPKEYDFSFEGAPKGYIEEKNEIDKYFIYRAGGKYHNLTYPKILSKRKKILLDKGFKLKKNESNNEKYISPIIIDPDSESKLLQKIYISLWNMKKIPEYMKYTIKIQGETLNSVNTTLNKFYKYIENEDEKKERGKKWITNKYILAEYLTKRDKIIDKFDDERIKGFLKTYHTIGNFMPIPVGCNAPRGTGPLHDYWDLTLLHIYNYYHNKDCKELEPIVGENNVLNYKAWLDCFGDWDIFVEKNYLQAFVDKEKGNYPKELWDGHFTKKVYPDKDQCLEYFEKATECIKNRSDDMIKKLNTKYKN